jgi:hypothetical protein
MVVTASKSVRIWLAGDGHRRGTSMCTSRSTVPVTVVLPLGVPVAPSQDTFPLLSGLPHPAAL